MSPSRSAVPKDGGGTSRPAEGDESSPRRRPLENTTLVAPDLRTFIAEVVRLLAPGGQWSDANPFVYPTTTPLGRHVTTEERDDLARLAGFRDVHAAAGTGGNTRVGRDRSRPQRDDARVARNEGRRYERAPVGVINAVLSLVDGRRNIVEIARALGTIVQMNPDELHDVVREVLRSDQ